MLASKAKQQTSAKLNLASNVSTSKRSRILLKVVSGQKRVMSRGRLKDQHDMNSALRGRQRRHQRRMQL